MSSLTMMSRSTFTASLFRRLLRCRRYATIEPSAIIVGRPPSPPQVQPTTDVALALHSHIIAHLSTHPPPSDLADLIQQYLDRANRVLDVSLPYESHPSTHKRVGFTDGEDAGVLLIAHWARNGAEHKVTLSSGFALDAPGVGTNECMVLTCAHTLEEIRWSGLPLSELPTPSSRKSLTSSTRSSASFVVSRPKDSNIDLHPVSAVLSSLPRSDLLLLSSSSGKKPWSRPFPVSPYPARAQTPVRAHFVADSPPPPPLDVGWRPWVGGMWSKWERGTVTGYRDFAGREAKPGTYDALSHMLFTPPPTGGSSGGPVVDEETGAVVGVMLGMRMDNRVEGVRGWGVPSEAIFEMFTLPGLAGKR